MLSLMYANLALLCLALYFAFVAKGDILADSRRPSVRSGENAAFYAHAGVKPFQNTPIVASRQIGWNRDILSINALMQSEYAHVHTGKIAAHGQRSVDPVHLEQKGRVVGAKESLSPSVITQNNEMTLPSVGAYKHSLQTDATASALDAFGLQDG